MVVIRLSRRGTKSAPKYRIAVADQRRFRDSKYLEVVGHYIPRPRGQEKELSIDLEKVKSWISKGAQPTERVRSLIRKASAAGVKA